MHRTLAISLLCLPAAITACGALVAQSRPNILFAIADDWGWPHAGAYGDAVVKTPAFDRIAAAGMLFRHAFVSSPSCTPSRGAILTGQHHWRLGSGANLYGTFADEYATYVELLTRAGYVAGSTGKTWGPGRPATRGRELAGPRHQGFAEFLTSRRTAGAADKPFVFWLGTSDPHRPYRRGSGRESGMSLDDVHLFGHFPDAPEVRGDVADYYFEVQRFDRLVGQALALLEKTGELDDTVVVMTGDHGMPFPRCKSNVYDAGVRVPLAIMWNAKLGRGDGAAAAANDRSTAAFVSLTDLAPTFLDVAGVQLPESMTGRSLLSLLQSGGRAAGGRDFVVFGKERHVPAQEAPDMGGYPTRAIRTNRYLYIRNFVPDRWPNGTPNFAKAAVPGNWFADTDNGPTKAYIVANKDKDAAHRRAYELCFAKRPAEELYDLSQDADCLKNIAMAAASADVRRKLHSQLIATLKALGDPRATGSYEYDQAPYSGGGPKHPLWRKDSARKDSARKKRPQQTRERSS